MVPILYRVLMNVSAFNAHFRYPPPEIYRPVTGNERVARYAKHVLLQGMHADQATSILKTCPNVEDLGLWLIAGPHELLLNLLKSRPIRRLSVNISHLFESQLGELNSSYLQHLTHMDIICVPRGSDWESWKALADLPNLTHLAYERDSTDAITHGALQHCSQLRVIVLFYVMRRNVPDFDGVFGPQNKNRVVVLDRITKPVHHWELGAMGQEDFWARADRILLERRQTCSIRYA